MKLSRAHLELLSSGSGGELDIVLHPTKPLILVGVVGTAVVLVMDPSQVDVLVERLQYVRGILRDAAIVQKSTPPTVRQ